MKRKIFDGMITIIAVIGFFILVGGVGTMDFMVEQKIDYPMINTMKTVALGLLMMLPAIIREVI